MHYEKIGALWKYVMHYKPETLNKNPKPQTRTMSFHSLAMIVSLISSRSRSKVSHLSNTTHFFQFCHRTSWNEKKLVLKGWPARTYQWILVADKDREFYEQRSKNVNIEVLFLLVFCNAPRESRVVWIFIVRRSAVQRRSLACGDIGSIFELGTLTTVISKDEIQLL